MVAGGYPAARHAHALSGQMPHFGARAVHTVAPSSISAAENTGAVLPSGSSASTSAWSRTAEALPASARPCIARATTRRTLVSTTGTARW